MANTDNPNGFTFVRSLSGKTGTPLVEVPLATTQTVTKGDALALSTGQATIAASSSGQIYGVAAESKTTTTSTAQILMYPATPDNLFEAQCEGTYAASMIGTACDIEGTTGIMEVNEDATTEKVFMIMEANSESEIGANTRVRGIFVRSSYTGLEDAET
jgi:hypothetical protein